VIGTLTLTPYDFWRRSHAIHHATSGNLQRRGIGDIDTLTVREYLALSRWQRLRYRLYRHPAVMFGPLYLFSAPAPVRMRRLAAQVSTMATNGDRRPHRDRHVVGGRRSIPAGASPDHVARGVDRRVAVLRAASVRGDDMGQCLRLAAARCGLLGSSR
jgi:hypothetical protein